MRHVVGKDRAQMEVLCLEDMIEANSPARQIDKLIDEADTSYFEKSASKDVGRRAYNPKDMLKLYVYGFENGVHSSRKLERECRRNIEVMWLMNGLRPDDKTICNFRKDNAENISRFFNEFCVTLAIAGYIDGKLVAIDGTKIRANNSKRNNFSKKKLKRHIEYIDNRLKEYLQEIEKNDRISGLEERKTKYEEYLEHIENGVVTEVSATDPDSRLMRQSNGGADVSYNIQTAVDGKNKLVAGIAVTNQPNDQGQLYDVAKAVKDNLTLEMMTVIADKGYYDTDDIKSCAENGITTYVAKPEISEDERKYKKADFTYIPEEDVFICPAGRKLKGSNPDKTGYKRYRNGKACKNCPLKHNCISGTRKDLGRHQNAEYAEKNDKRLKESPEIYRQRQLLSEHPFGTVKRTMGIRQFLTRGLTNVTAEAALIFLTYNLKRLRVMHNNDHSQALALFAYLSLNACLSFMTPNYSKNIRY